MEYPLPEPPCSDAERRAAPSGSTAVLWGEGPRVECLPLGPFETNSWLLWNPGGGCWVVDPGIHPEPLIGRIEDLGLVPGRILLTHGHLDHIAGCSALMRRWRPEICLPRGDLFLYNSLVDMGRFYDLELEPAPADPRLLAGDEVWDLAPGWRMETLATPGHSPGGVCYRLRGPQPPDRVFCGDTVFAGAFGRVDLPGGSLRQLVASIEGAIWTLPGETLLLPGHGPPTTVAAERAGNPIREYSAGEMG
jgi:hydroxyacylglutathione hydrolase